MERKSFLKSLMIGAVTSSIVAEACQKDSIATSTSSSGSTTTGGTSVINGSCSVAPTETEGPFPTKSPASYVRSDITDGRTGYKLAVNIFLVNSNNSCNALPGALVDIWHCDAQGNYSEYGGSGLQSTNYTSVHFLRGRQTTDSNGAVAFTSIFPGWYSGRATHIHVHVYNSSGTSLKVTQIAFPEGSGTAVAAVNGYSKGLSGYTYNASDNVFGDGYALELATVTGNTTDGFVLNITFAVPA
ncbi:intradiol ring-cleavage dioxygenase [Mucilaginibacter pallidiroseus]|uniref:Intradiol ring-cleavage dioxygenase n=1 Tax=Mucilaginibacter pallidiroseus TaxID=2599295 RepID=A0A563UJX9_9SPHI|nr:intradiol ring-cleavage dioxygenase [Mucilaginibacter pallidiroseus]TWR31643.1 intradiol ring-cleavage dioxygenase [Mucilaginibacter pallidiroseus]